MDIIQIVGICLIGATVSILLRYSKPEFTMMIPAVITFTVVLCILPYLSALLEELKFISSGSGIEYEYITIVLKIIGISYITAIAAELCNDAGEKATGSKIEIAGKLIILFMSIPIVNRLLEIVKAIIFR